MSQPGGLAGLRRGQRVEVHDARTVEHVGHVDGVARIGVEMPADKLANVLERGAHVEHVAEVENVRDIPVLHARQVREFAVVVKHAVHIRGIAHGQARAVEALELDVVLEPAVGIQHVDVVVGADDLDVARVILIAAAGRPAEL